MKLPRRYLGQTKLLVSRLCFGSLALAPMQANLSAEQGGRLIAAAFAMGINFLDTAESYENYEQIRWALDRGWSPHVHIATKSYAVDYRAMRASVAKALRELNRDYIDIFLLHEQESALTLKGHAGALTYLAEAKERGLVRAIGLSTHHVAGVRAGALHPQIDVIHPLINFKGWGIVDGSREEMVAAIKFAALLGKGIYAMKALGGGHFCRSPYEALQFVLDMDELCSVAVGMKNTREVEANYRFFSGERVPPALQEAIAAEPRSLQIAPWCQGCGTCIPACPQGALHLAGERVEVDPSLCVFCGYCSRVCPNFCLKVI